MSAVARAVAWFAVAYAANLVLHELAHACMAALVGVPATLHNLRVDTDRSMASGNDLVWIGVSGPLASLLIGAVAALALRRAPQVWRLPLFLVALFGITFFTGNLMSAAFVGDFSAAARRLGAPPAVRYAISAAGLVLTAAVMFRAGRSLPTFLPTRGQATRAACVGLVAAAGTALVILLNWPLPSAAVSARLGEGAAWVFAMAGAAFHRDDSARGSPISLTTGDVVALAVMAAAIRILMLGVPFTR